MSAPASTQNSPDKRHIHTDRQTNTHTRRGMKKRKKKKNLLWRKYQKMNARETNLKITKSLIEFIIH